MKKLVLSFVILFSLSGFAQEKKEEPKFGISFSGFVKTDFFYDTRQNINIREGHFLLYPDNIKTDLNGKDINEKDQFGALAIQSRITGKISGPDVLKAKSSALLEADFFGNENGNFVDVNGLRLRHAFIKLNWKTTELLVGQYWHPLFIAESFPDVVSFNTGAPLQPFSRNPQLRITQKLWLLKFIFAALEQRDFVSTGPEGGNSKYLRNSILPDLNFQLQLNKKWNDNTELFVGAGVEYKWLTPRLNSQVDKNQKIDSIYYTGDEKIKSMAVAGFVKFKTKPLTFKAYAIYGGNLTDLTCLGGYAVKSITDSSRWKFDYTPVNTLSLWGELSTNGKIQGAVFGGFTRNLGSADNNINLYFSRGSNINYVYRISPRMIMNFEKFRVALELEYTVAQYGKAANTGKVETDLQTVSNLRSLLAFYYFF